MSVQVMAFGFFMSLGHETSKSYQWDGHGRPKDVFLCSKDDSCPRGHWEGNGFFFII